MRLILITFEIGLFEDKKVDERVRKNQNMLRLENILYTRINASFKLIFCMHLTIMVALTSLDCPAESYELKMIYARR